MKHSWAQPSLYRDFALLSAGIFFILFVITAWVTFSGYEDHVNRIEQELERESIRIESSLHKEMRQASYFLAALGKQFVLSPDMNIVQKARILKSFDSRDSLYSILAWINADMQVEVSSNKGILDEPVDISDRDYVQAAMIEPWKIVVGQRIAGRVSGQWIIPLAMGITDNTGKFIGTVMISLDINALIELLKTTLKRQYINFAILNNADLMPVVSLSDDSNFPENAFSKELLQKLRSEKHGSELIMRNYFPWGMKQYPFYHELKELPYTVLLSYDAVHIDESFNSMVSARLGQFFLMALFLLVSLWVIRLRIIRPVLHMTAIAADVARGKPFSPLPRGGPSEIHALAKQVENINSYIEEAKRIEDELRHKMFVLKSAKERSEINQRVKSEFLAFVCQEMRNPLNNIIGFAQVMRDQLYGPIENRKYRQYTSDIYTTGNSMLKQLQELMVLSKVQTNYYKMAEKPVDLDLLIRRAQRFLADRLQADNAMLYVTLPDALPHLQADEFRLQELVVNLVLFMLERNSGKDHMHISAHVLPDSKELALLFSYNNIRDSLVASLASIARHNANQPSNHLMPETSLSFELASIVAQLHDASLILKEDDTHVISCIAVFPFSRIVNQDNG